MREQRDRLAEEIENLKASGIHTCHDQCKRPMCVMRRERDRLQNELNELKEDRDAWKSEALIMDARLRGVKHPNDNGIFSPDEVIPKLERELAETGEERDRLAEAMDRIAVLYESKEMTGTVDQRIADAYDMRCMARAALAAVKGGSDD
jgi:predicted RNase H-like nuclease (RuvC/YqgF family)